MRDIGGGGGQIRFVYGGGSRAMRRPPAHVPWRELPGALLERPVGGRWILETENGPPRTVNSGEVMVVPRGVRHRLRMGGTRAMRTEWAMLCFDDAVGRDLLALAEIPPVLPRRIGAALSPWMAAAREAESAVAGGDLAALAERYTACFRILEILLRRARVRRLPPPRPQRERLVPVLRHIETHVASPLSTGGLARLVHLSPSRFHALFRETFGMPPMAYVHQVRLRAAQHLLLTTTRPMHDIAAMTGFSSPYHFSRAFRRAFDTTPTAFRQTLRVDGPS